MTVFVWPVPWGLFDWPLLGIRTENGVINLYSYVVLPQPAARQRPALLVP